MSRAPSINPNITAKNLADANTISPETVAANAEIAAISQTILAAPNVLSNIGTLNARKAAVQVNVSTNLTDLK